MNRISRKTVMNRISRKTVMSRISRKTVMNRTQTNLKLRIRIKQTVRPQQ